MGSDAEGVTAALAESLAERRPDFTWNTEHYVGQTPVDVVGAGPGHVFIESEWRRADPANNTVKLFRHLSESDIDVRPRDLRRGDPRHRPAETGW